MRPHFVIAALVLLVCGVTVFLKLTGTPVTNRNQSPALASTTPLDKAKAVVTAPQTLQALEEQLQLAAQERAELREQLVARKATVSQSQSSKKIQTIESEISASAIDQTPEDYLKVAKKSEEERLKKLNDQEREVDVAKKAAACRKMFSEKFFDLGVTLGFSDDEVNTALNYMVDNQLALDPADSSASKGRSEKLSAIIGPEKFKALQSYQHRGWGREHVTELRGNFAKAGSPLTMDASLKLLSVFDVEIQKDYKVSHLNGNDVKSDAEFQQMVARSKDFNRRIVDAARVALDPDQIHFLEKSLREKLNKDQAFALGYYRKDGKWNAPVAQSKP